MTTHHIRGQWHAKEGQIYPLETGKTIALIPYFELGNQEQEANARLMASAPALLEALTRLLASYRADTGAPLNKFPDHIKAVRQAQDAIFNATN